MTLVRGLAISGLVFLAVLAFFLWVALKLPAPAGWIIFALAMLWMLGPYLWLWLRSRARLARLRRLLTNQVTAPAEREAPTVIVREIARVLTLPELPLVALVRGKTAIDSLPDFILVSDELYRLTSDRDLQWLLLHELAHHAAGHVPLLALAAAVPPSDSEGPVRLAMLPILPVVRALEEWATWADITADRLALVVHPVLELAITGVLQQTAFAAPESVLRTRLIQFLAREDAVDPGETVVANQAITELLSLHPDADLRVTNLRAWQEHPTFKELAQHGREKLASLPTRLPAMPLAPEPAAPAPVEMLPVQPEPVPVLPKGAPMPFTRLADLGIVLPTPPKPVGVYVPWTRTGNLIFLCGQLPLMEGKLPAEYAGKLGEAVSLERGQAAARQAALNSLAILEQATGGLEHVTRIIRLSGYIASLPTFIQQPQVLNGASELLAAVFGEAGAHARVAVGVAVLPLDACVEVDMIVEVADNAS
jgi:enamine deaminase RidA (YjgF/YER057c/UK114 family)/Zn-dependent protease with chaperone function